MEKRSGTARLGDSGDVEAHGLVATVSRAEVEEAVRADEGPVDLLLDVERISEEGAPPQTERVALSWDPEDLERVLASSKGSEVSLAFDAEELQRLLEEDVEAHGLRESLAVVTVVAGMAAGGAGAMVADQGGGPAAGPQQATASEISTGLGGGTVQQSTASEISTGLSGTAAERATPSEVSAGLPSSEPRPASASEVSTGIAGEPTASPSEVSTGLPSSAPRPASASEVSTGIAGEPGAQPSEVSTGITPEPTATPSEVSTGLVGEPSGGQVSDEGPSISAPGAAETAGIAGGIVLAITAAGFAVRAQRRRVQPT